MDELKQPPITDFERNGTIPVEWKIWFDILYKKVNEVIRENAELSNRMAQLEPMEEPEGE